ncbi:Hypothetical protein Pan44_25830 [Caulifigura coniformis]|uniref:Uncharacterized protein n=1 Tax=Caulifigura coniformis TaxID=2527983 RepID=A0A517SEJ8_9PLAN|nr:hypothetical protein [Caulifigura coniformis]QDT54550.1 Hypothetical protein Pan44_25830 [Caulifigura coniformis]
MGVIIGMDEAGLGPNLGPFVVAATVWEFPGRSRNVDLFESLKDAVAQEPCPRGRVHIADSKAIFSPARGLADLETSALAILSVANRTESRFPEILDGLSFGLEADDWMARVPPVDLPAECDREVVANKAARLAAAMEQGWIRCKGVHVEAVFPKGFNSRITSTDNKAAVCSQVSMNLLRRIWDPETTPAFVIGDRHGGRARYDQLLTETFGCFVFRTSETPELSRYQVGDSEVRFECRAEKHFAVACASIVAKYMRELSMRMFNAFWQEHVPNVRPTQGYPVDARRFAKDVAEARAALGIPDEAFWRSR